MRIALGILGIVLFVALSIYGCSRMANEGAVTVEETTQESVPEPTMIERTEPEKMLPKSGGPTLLKNSS